MKKYVMPSLSKHQIDSEIANLDLSTSVTENTVEFGGTGWGDLSPEDVN